MKRIFALVSLSAAVVSLSGQTAVLGRNALTPAWVEFADQGRVLVRIVIRAGASCPSLHSNTGRHQMFLRTPVPPGMQPVCELAIGPDIKSASVNGQPLALPRAKTDRVVVIGDTGCRIKGDRIQDCNDPAKWPLQHVATRAAAEKPDLVIHVGDYLYREDTCPQDLRHLCGTGPAGDRWETWSADFFTPAASLLAAAPWAFSRGNHEDCTRSWKGWFYYLDPRPFTGGGCIAYSEPYSVSLRGLQLFMLDSASLRNTAIEDQVTRFAAQLRRIRGSNVWLVDHHPFWDLRSSANGETPEPAPGPLAAAWDRAAVNNVSLILSGHTHLFELLTTGTGRPPQLIAGDGGTTLLETDPKTVNGATVKGVGVAGTSRREFGYTLLSRSKAGWDLEVKAPVAGTVVMCTIRGHDAGCEEPASR